VGAGHLPTDSHVPALGAGRGVPEAVEALRPPHRIASKALAGRPVGDRAWLFAAVAFSDEGLSRVERSDSENRSAAEARSDP
jgi:hypothetical protein